MKRYFKKGEYLQTSYGQDSDYCVGSVYRVLEDFDLKSVVEEIKQDLNKKHRNTYIVSDLYYDYDEVYEELMEKLPLGEVECTEVWLGAYGEFSEEVFEGE